MGNNPTYSPLTGRAYQTGQVTLPTTVGTELVGVDNGGATEVNVFVSAIATDVLLATENPIATASPFTLTGANIIGKYGDAIARLTATLAAAGTVTLPTVANLAAAFLGGTVPVNGGYTITIANVSSGNFAWTLAGNTGWTLNGPAANYVIPQYQYNNYLVQFTSQTTATITLVNAGFVTA
jgi:hypothetical protein